MNRWWRMLQHRWRDASDSRRWVPDDIAARLQARVVASEQQHLGEIRLCVEAALPTSYLWRCRSGEDLRRAIRDRALSWFGRLGVWDTEHNNGVLIYLQLTEHAIEVVADRGLSQRVDATAWSAMVDRLSAQLAQGQVEAGLAAALDEVTELLVEHFPATEGASRPNALPDAVVRA